MPADHSSPDHKFLSGCSLFKMLGAFEITSPLSDTYMPCSPLILQHLWKIGVWEWWLLSWVLLWLNTLVSHSMYWLYIIVLWDTTVRLLAPEVQKQGTNPPYYHLPNRQNILSSLDFVKHWQAGRNAYSHHSIVFLLHLNGNFP